MIRHAMKFALSTAFVSTILLALLTNAASAQTLTEKLVAENPTTLIKEARSKGDLVRGAILFHQGNINCARCHRASAEKDRMGPDLSRMDQNLSDEFIVESILQPSKVIQKGFETTVILSVEGQLYNGIVLSENVDEVVIRDSQNIEQPVTIRRDVIEEIRPGTTSSMPENLADELKDRQQFLDLLRYVIDIKERGPELNDTASDTSARRELGLELKGLVLIQELNCIACHKSETISTIIKVKQAPRLKWFSSSLNPEWIERFIGSPHAVKPGTTMPEMFGHLDEAEKTKTVQAITQFLVTQVDHPFDAQSIDSTVVPSGYELFHFVGCVACHSPRSKRGLEQPLTNSTPLGDLASKYSVRALVEFLHDPLAVRPSGHMPNMRLTHREASDIANFLLQSANDKATQWKLDGELAKQGETLFVNNNCIRCHTDIVAEIPNSPNHLSIDNLNLDEGCLSGESGSWPNFHLQDDERQAIQTAINRVPNQLTVEQQIDFGLQSFNCLACHERDNLGGVASDRNPHFQTTNLNLGDQGRIPPTLTGVGAKLQPKWMRDVLITGKTIRPYMKTRMPQYGEENIGHLIELFLTHDQLSETRFADFDDQEKMRKKGLELAGNEGLNCVSCHTYQYKLSDTMPAVDLTEMTDRLEKDWFYQYMLAPQKFSPNTVMPSFWPGGKAIRKDIPGTAEDQIEALWQYLIDGRQAAMPRGVVPEQLEIVVSNEARMLRRSYSGIGKRGLGVGYRGGVNLAFDAEQLRLDAIWKGKFVDPGGVWTGQGSGNVRAMGKSISFPKGPELDDRRQPWIVDEGRPPNHQFNGYELDANRRPTFRYNFDSIEVEDFFSEVLDDETKVTYLRRTVILTPMEGRGDLRFRIAYADEILPKDKNQFSTGAHLRIRVISDQVAQIVPEGEGMQLEIPIEVTAGQKQKLIIEYLWE